MARATSRSTRAWLAASSRWPSFQIGKETLNVTELTLAAPGKIRVSYRWCSPPMLSVGR